jgi:hypothetical protein
LTPNFHFRKKAAVSSDQVRPVGSETMAFMRTRHEKGR